MDSITIKGNQFFNQYCQIDFPEANACSNILIENNTFTGSTNVNVSNTLIRFSNVVNALNVKNIIIKNNEFKNGVTAILPARATLDSLVIENNTFTRQSTQGIYIANTVSGTQISGNTFYDMPANGISINANAVNTQIKNNAFKKFDAASTGSSTYISLLPSPNYAAVNITAANTNTVISNNIFDSIKATAVFVQQLNAVSSVTVADNLFTNAKYYNNAAVKNVIWFYVNDNVTVANAFSHKITGNRIYYDSSSKSYGINITVSNGYQYVIFQKSRS